jgi:hypothetical protein
MNVIGGGVDFTDRNMSFSFAETGAVLRNNTGHEDAAAKKGTAPSLSEGVVAAAKCRSRYGVPSIRSRTPGEAHLRCSRFAVSGRAANVQSNANVSQVNGPALNRPRSVRATGFCQTFQDLPFSPVAGNVRNEPKSNATAASAVTRARNQCPEVSWFCRGERQRWGTGLPAIQGLPGAI